MRRIVITIEMVTMKSFGDEKMIDYQHRTSPCLYILK